MVPRMLGPKAEKKSPIKIQDRLKSQRILKLGLLYSPREPLNSLSLPEWHVPKTSLFKNFRIDLRASCPPCNLRINPLDYLTGQPKSEG